MRTIPVGDRFAIVSDEDYERLSLYTWHFNSGYVRTRVRGQFRYMHNMVMGRKGVDHIDGDTYNNQRENLRPASHVQNGQNRKKQTGTSSRYKGVSWDNHRRKWTAHIRVDGKTRCLGGFVSEIDAAEVYDAAAREHFGEFARVNFP